MWILDSLSNLQLRKPFFVLWITLGAAFLLLANFFSINALYHPATYSLLTVGLWLIWQQERSLLNALIIPVVSIAAFFMVPKYLPLFAVAFTFLIGRSLFVESFKHWKWAISALLFYLSFPILSTWQSIPHVAAFLPVPLAHLVYAAVMAFCVQFALIPFSLRKD